jgi:hypothetical protein
MSRVKNSDNPRKLVEFSITLNDNIVIRREFEMDKYNPLVVKSLDWYDHVSDIRNWLENFLILKSSDFMSVYADEIILNSDFLKNQNNTNDETFNIFIKVDGEVIAHRTIDAKLFPPSVRYTLDIRPFMSDIRSQLVKLLSSRRGLTHNYLGYDLVV